MPARLGFVRVRVPREALDISGYAPRVEFTHVGDAKGSGRLVFEHIRHLRSDRLRTLAFD